MTTVFEALKWASSFLEKHGREATAAEWLLKHELDLSRTELLLMMRDEMPNYASFQDKIHQHTSGIPVQHICEKEEFYGRTFRVNHHVLVPRPETEELVEGILSRAKRLFPDPAHSSIADIGTGSGAIAISLALELSNSNVTAVDLSEEALHVAKGNARDLQAPITFVHGDLLDPLKGKKVDIVVSNPPYISEADYEALDPLVRDHEPIQALVGGEDGYDLYRRLATDLPDMIASPGLIGFEVGETQARTVAGMLEASFGTRIQVEVVKDISGKERMVFGVVN
ncbi:peptide chain release factor N(5)-glutamine methyltransferase [Alkalihalobacillus macyae]|uniref:peptide chain release factor N(5)-glutamine methyltransferase n=1 Tax=Guptibacillus hwajinpoensis TaxID=208199 RepID=UPI00273C3FD6|nr:peptide chain release factor N(5)-glutamine methyltransferase [Alkalihalobacillus macyae]MDP4551540.1 peptide chain release factor N(5)-glutamine methyltransferase [Alkalihalobacillus macyae]